MLVFAHVSLRPEVCRLVVQPLWGGGRKDMYRQEFQVLVNHHLEGWRKEESLGGSRWPFFFPLQTPLSLGRGKAGKAFCPELLIPIRCLGIKPTGKLDLGRIDICISDKNIKY